MVNVGAKIKELRKARKMTLADVAGDRLTKGMLSLIENGKAQPSMESLQHIAQQLHIDVAELMQSESSEEIHNVYLQAESLRTQMNKEYEDEKYDALQHQLYELIHPYVLDKRLKGQTFEEVRLYEMYVWIRNRLKMDTSIEPLLSVIPMYEQVHAYSKILKVYSRLAGIQFEQRKYEEGLAFIIEGENYLHRYGDLIDDLEKLDLYYNLIIFNSALNKNEQAEHYLDLALKVAKEKKIMYRMNDLYRFLFVLHCANGQGEKAKYCLNKIHALTQVLEDPIEIFIEQLLHLFYINTIEKDYKKTIATSIEQGALPDKLYQELLYFVKCEYGYAFWELGNLDDALAQLEDFKIAFDNQHPLDLLRFYRGFAIRALCYAEKGDMENAKRDILYAMDGVKDLANLADKQFVTEAYKKIIG